jgi:hypothetical protein
MEKQTSYRTVREVRIPWYYIVGAMLIITAVIIVLFSKPLDTTPLSQSAPAAVSGE